ncbi:tetratricopeptide repeat protein [Nitratireductor mangrovi]|uniref:Tetratricopeptide repeat protein n=1 Tax=Nitratireductor mangrovi TaxID=2599600 RepID=A0A5B8KWR5_9HYPH|nr:caspase family protein [Nitratireductor mangrovi]QDZ00157.1 tetratricopeptide repeat protein [Nitratireductor mangrovi]
MRIVFAAIFVVVTASAAFAERRVALVFGADRYEAIRPLANAVNDARAVEEALDALGFEVFSEANRDLRRMRRALEDFAEDAAGADVALIFFAGHGVEVAGENRLLPTDADASSLEALEASSLPLEELRRTAAEVADIALIVLDACRNDPFGASPDPQGRGAKALRLPATVKPGLGRLGRAENTLFAFSAAPGETAADGEGDNSPFTTALAKYLGTEGLEIRSVLTLVQQEVYDRSRGAQLPYVESGLPALFFASEASGDLPERERLLLAMADLSPQMREDVERIAADAGMPLAPLYGALIGGDVAGLNREERTEKLREAAASFTRVRDELRTLRSGDERVTALRRAAEEQLALGAFDGARAKLSEAANIDATSRETLKANYVERTLSEAATHYLNGGAAAAELKYQLAIADYEKAAALYAEVDGEQTFSEHDHFQYLRVLWSLGETLETTGNAPAAFETFGVLHERVRELASSDPTDVVWQQNLSAAYDRLGNIQLALGDLDAALSTFEQGLQIAKRLAASEPQNLTRQQTLSAFHLSKGDVQVLLGKRAAAKISFNETLAISKKLMVEHPENRGVLHDLIAAYQRIANLELAQGDLPGALKSYMAISVFIYENAGDEWDDPTMQRNRSVVYGNIARVKSRLGDLEDALRYNIFSVAIAERLAASDPGNARLQHDLLAAYTTVGDVRTARAELADAAVAYGDGHVIAERLATSNPDHVGWQRGLAISHGKIGDVRKAQGDLAGALTAYEAGLAIAERLAAADPGNSEWLRDLVVVYFQMAEAGSEPRENYQKALNIILKMQESGILAPSDASILGILRGRLEGLGTLEAAE